eukprot:CAMPEP_0197632300 /NCGR_PEP_ID=MMETSP1338-20131121/9116_1 /TAXON_ID=43686 ORGANISM="Pelagodinium beii, Strain RCC1491" /NCGR_SAMPLE_ID=MMETSP1338 /ASSEMBLY_ACC=CAM_ASM_000754 /LENGTH=526 /DNA_ID=CAMNT_0043203859 /DNA_START=51 /DNA_END=1631 /DNA_ORIENTATION=+
MAKPTAKAAPAPFSRPSPNLALDGAEVTMSPCRFDQAELRWVPTGEAAGKVSLKKDSGKNWRLVMPSQDVALSEIRTVSQLSPQFVVFELVSKGNVGLQCKDEGELKKFVTELSRCRADYERFEQYEQGSVQSYFQYYAKLANQQNMLQDGVRTSTYRRAIVENPDDFKQKRALDLGAGSGILSFFAVQAGAEKVYAVEASSMGEVIRILSDANDFLGPKIEVVNRPVETVTDEVDGKVDVLVSEPIGTFLFNERMIESYLVARDRFLKPGGKMYPNAGTICIAPFSDAMLHWEQQNKSTFWKNTDFYGVDLTAAEKRSQKESFRSPIVDYINPECLLSKAIEKRFDFTTISVESLQSIEIPFEFEISQPCLVHGMAGWFDAYFEGSNQTVLLSTAPWCPGTHWYQIRFLLEVPLGVNPGQCIEGVLKMEANNVQSYYIKLQMNIKGTNISSEAPCIDLKDPEYRFYSSPNSYTPPGTGANPAGQPQQPQQQHTYAQAHALQSQIAPMRGSQVNGCGGYGMETTMQ